MMKRYLYILFAVAAVVFTGCDNQFTSNMDNSVEKRYDDLVNGYYAEMQGSQYGWIAQLPTSKGTYQFWMSFDANGNVKMLSDNLTSSLVSKTTPSESLYAINQYQRPTLVFQTFCYLTILSDPNPAVSGGSATANRGLETDFEFGIRSFANSNFVSIGRFWDREFTMRKATQAEMNAANAGKMWDNLSNAINYKKGLYLYSMIDGMEVTFKLNERSVDNGYDDASFNTISGSSYTTTDIVTGDITYLTPFKVVTSTIVGLKWNAATATYTALVKNAAGVVSEVVIEATVAPLFKILGAGKPYDCGYTDIDIYDGKLTPATNPAGYMTFATFYRMSQTTFPYRPLNVLYYIFEKSTTTPAYDIFRVFIYFGGGYQGNCRYKIEYNANRSQFTIKDAGTRDGNFGAVVSFGVLVDLLNYFSIDKTFRVEWDPAGGMYDGSEIGQFTDVANANSAVKILPEKW